MILLSTPTSPDSALMRAAGRRLLPSSLGSAAQRQAFSLAVRGRAVFSARTTNAAYLQAIKEAVERAMQEGIGNDFAKLKLELRDIVRALGYTPEHGFPGDAALGVPPAEPGSLRDLSSEKRIALILHTQLDLFDGAGLKTSGEDRADRFPWWELVRQEQRRVPRGSAIGSLGWLRRWHQVGGPGRPDLRMIAPKGDPIWSALGDSSNFDDALDTDHPPFAFNSGMGWLEISRTQGISLGLPLPSVPSVPSVPSLPDPKSSAKGMDAALLQKLRSILDLRDTGKIDQLQYAERVRAA